MANETKSNAQESALKRLRDARLADMRQMAALNKLRNARVNLAANLRNSKVPGVRRG